MALPASNSYDRSFPKTARLRQRSDYVQLSQTGTKYTGRHFIVLIGNIHAAETRIGITVSRKVGCAVVRNRVKRVLRECFRLNRTLWPNSDIVVIARSSAASATYAAILRDLLSLLQRITIR